MYMKATSIFRRVSYALALAALFALVAAATKADDTTYTYTSSPYTDWSVFVPCPSTNICETTGTLTFATPLPDNMSPQTVTPESYSFTDGITVLDNTNSSILELELGTNASGQITEWNYFFTQGDPAVDLFELCGDSTESACGLAGLNGAPDYYDQAEYDINSSPSYFIEYAVSSGGPGVWTGGGTDQSGSGGGDGGGNGNGTNVPEPGVITMLALGLAALLGRAAWRRHAGGQFAA